MTMFRSFVVILVLATAISAASPAFGGVGLRVGSGLPVGNFNDYAKLGWGIDVLADFRVLPISAVRMVVAYDRLKFGDKHYTWPFTFVALNETSRITVSGVAVGARLEPPTPVVKPFFELLARLASVQQETILNNHSVKNSATKFGYQINGGVRYALAPAINLEAGLGYTSFAKTNLSLGGNSVQIAPSAWNLFLGVHVNTGF